MVYTVNTVDDFGLIINKHHTSAGQATGKKLLPLTLPDNFAPEMFTLVRKEMFSIGQLPSNVDTKELKRAISFLMEALSLMTSSCLFYVMLQLMDCVSLVHDLSPAIFKSRFIQCVCTADFPLFHLVFLLKSRFHGELFTDSDEELIIRRLLIYANNPSFTSGHRLLCYDWLLHFPENQQQPSIHSEEDIPATLDYSYYASLFPRVFDDINTKVTKLNVLSLCFEPGNTPDSAAAMLMSSLVCLHKSVHYGVTGRPAIALYRVLFTYYRRHQNTTLVDDIYKFILSLFMEHPKFASQTIDFLEYIREITAD
uniref:AP-5 complex subunit beta-1-like n=1 Tax=Saccoglossus kowalevskii TaxID=10224 RepID=A0ABM0MFF6_SACKO